MKLWGRKSMVGVCGSVLVQGAAALPPGAVPGWPFGRLADR